MSALKVSEIWTYPVKSLGGIPAMSAKVLLKGLETDRRWMLVDEQNIFMTQRVHHKMALFKPEWVGSTLRVNHKGDSIDVPSAATGEESTAQIWDDFVKVVEVHPDISRWFSSHLSMTCRLVAFPEANFRGVDPRYRVADDQVSLADAYPLLIIGQSSLDDLNERLQEPVPMNRFRPNIVFTGGEPFEEDTWTRFTVGDNAFAAVKPCDRCAIPTIDQATGTIGKEPTATLSKYRKKDAKVYFGMNLIPLEYKEIHVGDEIKFQ